VSGVSISGGRAPPWSSVASPSLQPRDRTRGLDTCDQGRKTGFFVLVASSTRVNRARHLRDNAGNLVRTAFSPGQRNRHVAGFATWEIEDLGAKSVPVRL
jgi:hypothetical protein